jgi:hypothetical protein
MVGIFSLYFIPGMIICVTLMSWDKSSQLEVNLTKKQKRIRFLLITLLRSVIIFPSISVLGLKMRLLENRIHFSLAFMIILTPSIMFGIQGHLLKMCNLEIKSDFI